MTHAKAARRPLRATTAPAAPAGNATAGANGAAQQPLTRRQISATLRGLIVLVTWNVVLFARYLLLTDASFPIEALLPVGYAVGSVFLRHDELRIARATLVREAFLLACVSYVIFDLPVAEIMVRATLVVGALQWCHLRLALALAVGFMYLGFNCVVGVADPPEPRHALIAAAVHATFGLGVAFTLRMNRLCLAARAILHEGIDHAGASVAAAVDRTPGLAFLARLWRRHGHARVSAVLQSRAFAEMCCWWALMIVDWTQRVSLGGLAISACLVVGFGTSLAQDRTGGSAAGGAAGRPRYVYQLLLIGAVWASDVSIFLATPLRTLPFVANSVISAYFVLYCAAPASSPPKLTCRAGNALEITPVPPRATSTLLPAALWAAMVGTDLYVQSSRGWEEPSLGRALLSVNTAGYGILMLTSTFLEAFSRDARVRARMQYLEDDGVSPDAVALRQIVEDVESSSELANVLAGAGIDVADLGSADAAACASIFTAPTESDAETPNAAGPAEAAPQGANHLRAETPALPMDSESSEASEAGHNANHQQATTNAADNSAASQSAKEAPVSGSSSSRKGTPAASNTPEASRQASFAGAAGGNGSTLSDSGLGGPAVDDADAAARRQESAEEVAAREKARREADEARRRLKHQQKLEAQRQHEQRLAEAAERREKLRREHDVNEVLDGERRARDSIVSKEKNAREKMHSGYQADARAIVAAARARKERDERLKRQAAEEEARKVAAEKKGKEKEQRAKEQQQAKAAEAAAAAAKAKEAAAAKAAAPAAPVTPSGKSGKSIVPLPRSANEKAAPAPPTTVAPKAPAPASVAKGAKQPAAVPPAKASATPKQVASPTSSKAPSTPASSPVAPAASGTGNKKDRQQQQAQPQQQKEQQSAKQQRGKDGKGGKADKDAKATAGKGSPAAGPASTADAPGDGSELIGRLLASLGGGNTSPSAAPAAAGAVATPAVTPPAAPRPPAEPKLDAFRVTGGGRADDDDAWNFINNQVQSVLDENADDAVASSPASGKTFGEPSSRTGGFGSDPGSFTVAAPHSGTNSPAPAGAAAFRSGNEYSRMQPQQQPQPQPQVAYAAVPQVAGGQYVLLPDGTMAVIMPQQIPGGNMQAQHHMYQHQQQQQYYMPPQQQQYGHYGEH